MSAWFLDSELSTCFIRNGIIHIVFKKILSVYAENRKLVDGIDGL